MSGTKKAPDKYGSIVFIVGRRRAYGIRARLHLPTDYFVYDTQQLAQLTRSDPDAIKHNYFDAYFSLSGEASGEEAPVEAGIFKYSGEQSTGWKAARTGVAGWDFHGNFIKDKVFSGRPHTMQLGFVPGEKDVVELKVDGNPVWGPMTFKHPIEQATYDAGGLYPKASIGMCNFGGRIRFGRITLSNLQINHDPALKESGWTPFTDYSKHNKFTHGDWIDSERAPFSAWTPAPRIGGKRR